MSARLLAKSTLAAGLRVILNDVIALHGAEFGNIQLAIDANTLAIVEQRGFDRASLARLRRLGTADDTAVSARAFAARRPIVVSDITEDARMAPFVRLAGRIGVRAMQATPLIAPAGVCVGIVSTHFANVHTPTDIEMETLQQYGAIAAGFIQLKTKGRNLAAVADACFQRLISDLD